MADAPGQLSGHFSWDDLVAGWIAERGSLAEVARFVVERRGYAEDVVRGSEPVWGWILDRTR